MTKAVEFYHDQLRSIRSGSISPGLLDSIRVPFEGQNVPLEHLAWTVTKQGQIHISPYNPEHIQLIAGHLQKEGFNAYPFSKTAVVVSIPKRSGEDREKVVRHIKKLAEEARVSVRNIRKKARKDHDDEEVQRYTNKFISEIDELMNNWIKNL